MIKKLKVKNYKLQADKGMTLFIAVTIMGILLFVSFAVVNISMKSSLFSSSGRDSQLAFYAADAGIDCAIYWDSKTEPSKFTDPASVISCGGYTIQNGVNIAGTSTVTKIAEGGVSASDIVWFGDGLPSGAQQTPGGFNYSYNWASFPSVQPYIGSYVNQIPNVSGLHQQFFTSGSPNLSVDVGDTMFAYVYLDPTNPPTELMLQWNNGIGADGGWAHRAYWGNNSINWGTNGTNSRRYIGPMPPTNGWVRLNVAASEIGLEGTSVNGVAFTLYDGTAYLDNVGKSTSSGGSVANSIFGFELDNGVNPTNACAIVTVTKSAGTTYIKSRGYNTCEIGNPRRIERGVEVTY